MAAATVWLGVRSWRPGRACPSRRLPNEIGEHWTVLIVGALSDGPLRFKAIGERVDGISYRMLTQTLRTLERDGLVTRTQYPEIPPRVEYELTDFGRELVAPPAGAGGVGHLPHVGRADGTRTLRRRQLIPGKMHRGNMAA